MEVRELNKEQLEELKTTYYFQLLVDDAEAFNNINDPLDIADEVIFDYYGSIVFVEEDFFCSLNQELTK